MTLAVLMQPGMFRRGSLFTEVAGGDDCWLRPFSDAAQHSLAPHKADQLNRLHERGAHRQEKLSGSLTSSRVLLQHGWLTEPIGRVGLSTAGRMARVRHVPSALCLVAGGSVQVTEDAAKIRCRNRSTSASTRRQRLSRVSWILRWRSPA
jgi:hypothetical protein